MIEYHLKPRGAEFCLNNFLLQWNHISTDPFVSDLYPGLAFVEEKMNHDQNFIIPLFENRLDFCSKPAIVSLI